MGRIFEKRKERMFARWAKNAKAFTKLGKELSISVRLGGADPNHNPRLRLAIQNARSINMPKDRIEAAIARAVSKDATDLQEINYEAFGPHGVGIFIESATDNPTRTVANIRSTLNRWGGSLASTGAVAFLFETKGVFKIKLREEEKDEIELYLIDFGLDELEYFEDGSLVFCSFSNFGSLQKGLESKQIEVLSSAIQRIPINTIELNQEQQTTVDSLILALEDDDDVQSVYHTIA
jgi:YebC/PmpR family DNA-binding regulatory protein